MKQIPSILIATGLLLAAAQSSTLGQCRPGRHHGGRACGKPCLHPPCPPHGIVASSVPAVLVPQGAILVNQQALLTQVADQQRAATLTDELAALIEARQRLLAPKEPGCKAAAPSAADAKRLQELESRVDRLSQRMDQILTIMESALKTPPKPNKEKPHEQGMD